MNEDGNKARISMEERLLGKRNRRLKEAWESVLSTPQGRQVLYELMEEFGLYQDCFDKNGQEMSAKVARQGCAQNIKNKISFWFGANPWISMIFEAKQRQDIENTERGVEQKQLDEHFKRGKT
jgi:hypothetical protein